MLRQSFAWTPWLDTSRSAVFFASVVARSPESRVATRGGRDDDGASLALYENGFIYTAFNANTTRSGMQIGSA